MSEKPEALRLADALIEWHGIESFESDAADELRRLAAVEAQRDALLEALKVMAQIIDKMGDMPDGFIHPSPWQTLKCEEALTQARAAIKQAEGETNGQA